VGTLCVHGLCAEAVDVGYRVVVCVSVHTHSPSQDMCVHTQSKSLLSSDVRYSLPLFHSPSLITSLSFSFSRSLVLSFSRSLVLSFSLSLPPSLEIIFI
jgi:hypothetical protein